MEFVLFLCAALSALTGAITGARVPGVAVQIERVSVRSSVAAPVAPRAVAAIVMAQRPPILGAVLALVEARPFVLSPAIPPLGSRRRE
ncbi:hypothetical protein BH10PSE15_BH10PSE15_17690 [soil metagenome]